MNWIRFLEENNIHYVTRGPNTKRGEVSIRCPMCGEDDPSEHLGINLQNWAWGCHRDASHRGKSPRTLIKALLACGSAQARLVVRQYSHSDPDALDAALMALEGTHEVDVTAQTRRQRKDPEFNDFSKIKSRGITKRFFKYLQGRGYEDPTEIINKFDLRCASTGKYQDRIILPVRLNGELLGWTSRAIGNPKLAPRYLASSEDVKMTVLNYDELIKEGGQRLFIVEGPFDAIKMDGHVNLKSHMEIRATCTFGTSVTLSQIVLLRNLVKAFTETWILFDVGAERPANDICTWVGANLALLPSEVKDPSELSESNLDRAAGSFFPGYFIHQNKSYLQHLVMPANHRTKP